MESTKEKENMKGRKVSHKTLEAEGWKVLTLVTDGHLIFGKRDKRIAWNKEIGIVEHEYTYKL
jgi:hypothetical protein